MHFEILVEDQSGKKALDILVPKIIDPNHTFVVRAYKGIGRLPKNLKGTSDPSKRILLDRLPKLLRGYGKTFAAYGQNYRAAVIVICDLDDQCLKKFKDELLNLLNQCDPQPLTRFCLAIEEGEAWFLGDLDAIAKAYPNAKFNILNSYNNDSICGTWETLADAIYPGGVKKLLKRGGQEVGRQKSLWAEKITPHMNVTENKSPSFRYFYSKMIDLLSETST
jgi:hypothetical protein